VFAIEYVLLLLSLVACCRRCPNELACENNATRLLPLHPFQPSAYSTTSSNSSNIRNLLGSAPAPDMPANPEAAYTAAQCR
jgi:hypothetical protein